MKEKLISLAEEYKEINSKPKQFQYWVFDILQTWLFDLSFLSILCVMHFCETRKINSNATRVLFLLLSFHTKLSALKTIFQRGWALNKQDQKLFQLEHTLNQDIYGSGIFYNKVITIPWIMKYKIASLNIEPFLIM